MSLNRLFSKNLCSTKLQEIIFIMGGPGSGKGTQSEILKNKMHYCHISTGNLIRGMLKKDTACQKLREEINQGVLFDAEMIVNLVKKEMLKYPKAKGFLLDGCPRTMEQLMLFEKEVGICDKIIYLHVPEKIMEKRMLERSIIEKREDDNAETIRHRINSFQKQTSLVLNHLEKNHQQIFYKIDGSRNIDLVAEMIQEQLNKKFEEKRLCQKV